MISRTPQLSRKQQGVKGGVDYNTGTIMLAVTFGVTLEYSALNISRSLSRNIFDAELEGNQYRNILFRSNSHNSNTLPRYLTPSTISYNTVIWYTANRYLGLLHFLLGRRTHFLLKRSIRHLQTPQGGDANAENRKENEADDESHEKAWWLSDSPRAGVGKGNEYLVWKIDTCRKGTFCGVLRQCPLLTCCWRWFVAWAPCDRLLGRRDHRMGCYGRFYLWLEWSYTWECTLLLGGYRRSYGVKNLVVLSCRATKSHELWNIPLSASLIARSVEVFGRESKSIRMTKGFDDFWIPENPAAAEC